MKICIDAGHDYSVGDIGMTGYGEREADITFEIANKLTVLFENKGFDVIMTRSRKISNLASTPMASIKRRAQIANDSECDLFISIHCNYNCSIRHNGTETQIFTLDEENKKLAEKVQQRIVKKLGTGDRGVRKRNVEVLKRIYAPAISVETAFITNENDVQLLRNRGDDFARAIFEGVLEYLNMDVNNCKITAAEAAKIIQNKAGLNNEEINYLRGCESLLLKLASTVK